MSRCLVTGASGFAGRHLVRLLAAAGHEPLGLDRGGNEPPCPTLTADLTDPETVREAVVAAAPEYLFHLAAISSPAASRRDPATCLAVNVAGTAAVLQGALTCRPRPRVLLVTSSEIYGVPASTAPLTETCPPAPRHAYGVSKLAVSELGRQVHRTEGLEVIEARPFNHTGPGQRLGFVVPDFASQVAAIADGRAEPVLRVGDLRAARDFSDVRDIVRGYLRLAESGEPGEAYHLCSGRAVAIREILETLLELAGVAASIEVEPALLRPEPPTAVAGSFAKARRAVGWQPERPLRQTLADTLADWRR